nr:putative reverse transcriptase domain, ribonuclease H-like domain, aspartic peptidase domain protein [Tanacetum cinerariifolium]
EKVVRIPLAKGKVLQIHGERIEGNPKSIKNIIAKLEDSLFTIDLLLFGYESFDLIKGMNWFSKHMVEIVCHEKVVRIPLAKGKVLQIHGERIEGNPKSIKNTIAGEQKLDDIPIMQDFWNLRKIWLHIPDFQNTSTPSNASTNVVNAPREPYKDVLRDGEACKQCTCAKCGSGLGKGLCYICGHNQNSLNDSLSISKTSSQSPPNINHCCYECGDPLDGIFCKRCTCKSCGKDAHIGYNCPSKVPVISISKPCNNQTIDELPQALPIFHPTLNSEAESPFTLDSTPTNVDESPNRQPMNEDYYHEQNSCYDSNSIGFDQSQPQQYTINHPIFNAHNDVLTSQTTIVEQMIQLKPMVEMFCQFVLKKREEKRIKEEQAAKAQNWKFPVCYDDDDDEEGFNSLQDNIISELPPCSAITPNEPVDSLIIEDEHFDTIPVTESDEFIKSSVENLVPIPSESEDESECDVPDCDDSQMINFSTFSNPLFDDFTSSNDESSHDEDIHEMSFKTYSNPLFDLDEEIISSEFNPIHNEDLESNLKNDRFDTEPYLLESLPNRDTLMSSPLKIDSLLAEFAGALIFLKSIPPEIDEADCDPEEDIHLVKRLLYDNSSPRPSEEIVSDNSNVDIEYFSPYPILNEDSASHMEEINLFLNQDDPMPPSIEEDNDDSERDIPINEKLPNNYSLSLPNTESYHFDIPSPYRPPAKPPDGQAQRPKISASWEAPHAYQ